VPPEQIMLVGDYVLDLSAAHSAGALAVLLLNEAVPPAWAKEADYVIASLDSFLRSRPRDCPCLPVSCLRHCWPNSSPPPPRRPLASRASRRRRGCGLRRISGGPTTLRDGPELLRSIRPHNLRLLRNPYLRRAGQRQRPRHLWSRAPLVSRHRAASSRHDLSEAEACCSTWHGPQTARD
jgi:hypothetical protein